MLLYAYPKYSSSVNADLGHSSSWLRLSVMLSTKGPRNTNAVPADETILRPISVDGTIFPGRLNARPSNLSKHSICCNSQLGTCTSEASVSHSDRRHKMLSRERLSRPH